MLMIQNLIRSQERQQIACSTYFTETPEYMKQLLQTSEFNFNSKNTTRRTKMSLAVFRNTAF